MRNSQTLSLPTSAELGSEPRPSGSVHGTFAGYNPAFLLEKQVDCLPRERVLTVAALISLTDRLVYRLVGNDKAQGLSARSKNLARYLDTAQKARYVGV